MENDKLIKEAHRFKKMFDRIMTESLPIYTNNRYSEIYVIPEGEEFRQVWTDNVNAKYYKCRNQIAPYYFISNYGNIVSMYGGKACLVNPFIVCKEHLRLHINIYTSEGASSELAPEHLVCMTFEGDADSEALKIIQEYGLDAFRRSRAKEEHYTAVEIHHKYGHKTSDDEAELRKLNRENCRLDGLQFVCGDLHDKLSYQPKNDELVTNTKYLNSINDVCQSHGLDSHTVVFWGDDRKEITEYTKGFGNVRFKDERGQITLMIAPFNDEAKRAKKTQQLKDIEWIRTDKTAWNSVCNCLKNDEYTTLEARWNTGREYFVSMVHAVI